jgi:hypothetical protein
MNFMIILSWTTHFFTLKAYVYAWVVSLIILLPWTTHFQHQNNQNPKVFPKAKLQQQLCIPNYDYLQRKVVFLKVTNTPLYINQKETS